MRLDHASRANIDVLAPGIRVTNGACYSALGRTQRYSGARSAEGARGPRQVSGGDIKEATPDPFPNSEVKLLGADGTARET